VESLYYDRMESSIFNFLRFMAFTLGGISEVRELETKPTDIVIALPCGHRNRITDIRYHPFCITCMEVVERVVDASTEIFDQESNGGSISIAPLDSDPVPHSGLVARDLGSRIAGGRVRGSEHGDQPNMAPLAVVIAIIVFVIIYSLASKK